MELKFGQALFAAGAFLILVGIVALISDIASSVQNPGALEAFSRGFDTIFLSLFSGVLIGVGIALVGNGAVLHTLGNRRHILLASLCSLLFLALSLVAVLSRGGSALFSLVAFFAGISASGAFLFTALWYALSSAARKYLGRD